MSKYQSFIYGNLSHIGWNYANCLPYFRKAQTHELNGNQYRGSNGPLYVSRAKTNHPLHSAWIEAGKQAGYPFTDDVNGYQQVRLMFRHLYFRPLPIDYYDLRDIVMMLCFSLLRLLKRDLF